MRVFNKLLKPVFVSLHELGQDSSSYVDDSLLLAQTFERYLNYLLSTKPLLQELEFFTHQTKF